MNKIMMISLAIAATMVTSTVKAAPNPGNANLILWLDADDLDGDGSAEGATEDGLDNGKITNWVDKATSNGSQSAVQSDTNQQPAYVLNTLNGNAVARFDADRLLTGLDVYGDLTIIAVAKEDQRHIGGIVGHAASRNGDIQFGDVKYGSNDINNGLWCIWSNYKSAYANNLAPVDQNWSILSMCASAAPEVQWIVTKNGRGGAVRTQTAGPSVNSQIRSIQVGAGNADNEWWDGDIAELLVYNTILSDEELDAIGEYLSQKHGVGYYDYVAGDNPNLVLWLDADDLDGDGSVEGAAEEGLDNGRITNWVDKAISNGSQNAVQGTAARQPAYVLNSLNGRPVASMDEDRLLTGLSVSNTFTLVAVVKENQRHIGGIVGHAISHNRDIQFGDVKAGVNDYNNGLWCAWTAGGAAYANILAPVDQEWSILSLSVRTSPFPRWLITKNGTGGDVVAQASGTINNDITDLQVGAADSDNEFWDGDIAEVLVFNYALSYMELEQVGEYLSEKYNINFDSYTIPQAAPYVSGSDTYYSDSAYLVSKTIDGSTATFCAIMDDSLDGSGANPPGASDPVTGHIIYDMGEALSLISGVRLVSRNDSSNDYNPSSVDFFCFVDDNPANNALADDIENDDDIMLISSHAFSSLKANDWESVVWEGIAKRYIGMRINNSYEPGPSHFNCQFAEIGFVATPFEWPQGSLIQIQ